MNNIAVIGGGASGIFAAITAARTGCNVTVYEKNDRIGKKLLATGNGRCNLTNVNACEEDYHGSCKSFVENAKKTFWVDDTLDFFSQIGLLTKIEENGKVYPYCDRASAVLDVLRAEAQRLGVNIACGFDVKGIKKKNNFKIISYDGKTASADKIIFSCGGKASPSMSSGSGYDILKLLGHTITPLRPSIVQLKTDNKNLKGLKGIKCKSRLSLGQASFYGELLFTDDGLSGPPAFFVSSYYNPNSESNAEIDFFDEYSEKELFTILKSNTYLFDNCEQLFSGMLHKRIAAAILKQSGAASPSTSTSSLSNKALSDICRTMKHFPLSVIDTASWNNAQVTSGGVISGEINSESLESKICSGLYLTGEILDIDGNCGGYNLQWAWTSGFIAAIHAAEN